MDNKFASLSLEEFYRIVKQDNSVELKTNVTVKPPVAGQASPNAVTYIDIILVDHENGGKRYTPEVKISGISGGMIKKPEDRVPNGPSFVFFKSTAVSKVDPNVNLVSAMKLFMDKVKHVVEHAIETKVIADKKSKDINTKFRHNELKIKMNTVTYETQSGDVIEDPFVRVTLYTDKDTKTILREPIMDATKVLKDSAGNITGFGVAMNPNTKQVYNANDIHEFITGGSIHMGILSMTSISLSGQGISVPVKMRKHVVKKGVSMKDASINSYFDASDIAEMVSSNPTEFNNEEIVTPKTKETTVPVDIPNLGDINIEDEDDEFDDDVLA
jgi:hypothetical protein